MLSYITNLLSHYGYIVLYVVLSIELTGLPTPGETLMTYCGFLVSQGRLNWVLAILVASLGVMTGVTISYTIGRTAGLAFFKKFGRYIHLGPERLDKMSGWFESYGDKLLFITYFVPGVRHVTGYFSGIMRIPYKKFALKAYSGAFIWTSTFISLGKVLGTHYRNLHGSIRSYLIIAIILIAAVLLVVYFYRFHKKKITGFVLKSLYYLNSVFHSLGRIKILIFCTAFVFIGLSVLVFWITDNFLENDLIRFDRVVNILTSLIFSKDWTGFMKAIGLLTSFWGLAVLSLLVFLWIMRYGSERLLEIRSMLIALIGGVAVSYGLILLFNHLILFSSLLSGHVRYQFPSRESLTAVVFYGYAAFMVMRHSERSMIRTAAGVAAFMICFFSGLSPVYLRIQYPSDVLAGFTFGGIWLSINIILLEVFRILPGIQPIRNKTDEP